MPKERRLRSLSGHPGSVEAVAFTPDGKPGVLEIPKRTILFAAVGAEEQGLLGSKHFAVNPPVSAEYLAAVLNIAGVRRQTPAD